MMPKECEIIKCSARIPANVDNKVKLCAKKIGVSKNTIMILALKDYIAKEVNV
ncbi:hypothetical protein Ga0466249_004324 [Sporomusaceae bacterium BoRhaA]|uniref:ribbon-helix-helix domain-containing protein n=1 Tax=Pelorhabdus rhamnosifermentans TaxID=2772457 RepID=UPI001C0641B3|nr:ribbon-helix-helix domain-containing protein [Pelorhabdus rhamnosifermentans]MBU2703188.1 hypothetical protein [Pelorhabdus rhamnosifermentans]